MAFSKMFTTEDKVKATPGLTRYLDGGELHTDWDKASVDEVILMESERLEQETFASYSETDTPPMIEKIVRFRVVDFIVNDIRLNRKEKPSETIYGQMAEKMVKTLQEIPGSLSGHQAVSSADITYNYGKTTAEAEVEKDLRTILPEDW